jgi:hypothetical protein
MRARHRPGISGIGSFTVETILLIFGIILRFREVVVYVVLRGAQSFGTIRTRSDCRRRDGENDMGSNRGCDSLRETPVSAAAKLLNSQASPPCRSRGFCPAESAFSREIHAIRPARQAGGGASKAALARVGRSRFSVRLGPHGSPPSSGERLFRRRTTRRGGSRQRFSGIASAVSSKAARVLSRWERIGVRSSIGIKSEFEAAGSFKRASQLQHPGFAEVLPEDLQPYG